VADVIVVTGATGTVGSHVLRELAGGDRPVRAAVRSPDRFDGPADEVVAFDFTDPATYRAAFAGSESLFLVRPPALSNVRRDVVPPLSAAIGAGVEHVVFLSVIGADRARFVPHARIESWLGDTGVATTFLRASFFMQNLTTVHGEEIRRGRLSVPAGGGKTSFVDARDVAAVGVRALREGLTGAFDLTGPEALSYDEVCDVLSSVLPHRVAYVDPSLARFLVDRLRAERDPAKALVMGGIYTSARLGLAGRVTNDVSRTLGRDPVGFEAFVLDHRELLLGDGGVGD